MPNKGQFKSNITWQSSNPDVIGADGVVKQQSTAQTVILTATVKHSDRELKLTKSFQVTVAARKTTNGGGGGGGGVSSSKKDSLNSIILSALPITQDTTDKPADNDNGAGEDTKTDKYNLKDLSAESWSYPYVTGLMDNGILAIPDDGNFRPTDSLKREEAVKMLVELFGIKNDKSETNFLDVAEDNWAYVYIASATENGIVNGMGDNTFGIGKGVTRQDFAVMVYNALCSIGAADNEKNITTFEDSGDIAEYAAEAVSYLVRKEIINGTDDNKFMPLNEITRQEAAKIVYGVLGVIRK